ncbi:LysR family transcriptional regulator [Paraburkholderia sp.]|uniref:LysR family transcriptional regulator n=1 Tax=Paraburkholderia sp. TaxID=1926495 RepID=UPI0039E3C506
MDFHRLKCFVAVMEAGSLSKAAVELNMTQPPLSLQIRKLEDELGVTLFERVGKRLIPTDTAKLFFDRAKEILMSLSELSDELRESHAGLRGTVVVGCSTAASLFIIPEVMKRLQKDAEHIVVRVREGETNYVMNELRHQRVDVAIVRTIFQAEDLQVVTLFEEPLMLALPPRHPLTRKKRVTIGDLRNERFLLHATTHGQGISDQIIEQCHLNGFSPHVTYWGSETLPMLLMVRQGLGISFAPRSFRHIRSAVLPSLIAMSEPQLRTRLSLVTLKDRYRTAVTSRFLQTTSEVIAAMREND